MTMEGHQRIERKRIKLILPPPSVETVKLCKEEWGVAAWFLNQVRPFGHGVTLGKPLTVLGASFPDL